MQATTPVRTDTPITQAETWFKNHKPKHKFIKPDRMVAICRIPAKTNSRE
jgi:hypothetical protein